MNELRKLVAALTTRQRISLVLAALLVGGGLYGLARWNRERDFEVLYAGLAPEDAGQLLERIRERGVDYRLRDGGASILVPSARVAEMRLEVASAGLPRSGRMGFELFDQSDFGATDFAERVNFQRALEGELERSVMALSVVEKARVHITPAGDSVFLESRRPAKGSVLVQLRPGGRLSPQNVQALCHLVASAVEGLDPGAVSILDMNGNLLNRPRPSGAEEETGLSSALLDYRQSVEKDLLGKIQRTLEPLLGADRFRAGVSVECALRSGEESEERFDPERSVMTSSERTEDLSGAPLTTGGIPGTASNLPRPRSVAGLTGNGHTRRTENLAFQNSRVVRTTRIPQGEVERVSVALLVDHEVRWEGEGAGARRVVAPLAPERLEAIRGLVAGAVGLREDRGDRLVVESLPFEATRNWQPLDAAPSGAPESPAPGWLRPYLENRWMLIAAGGGLLLLLVIAGLFLMARKRRGRRGVHSVTTPAALPAADASLLPGGEEGDIGDRLHAQMAEHAAAQARVEEEALKSLRLPPMKTKKTEALTKHLADEAQKDPVAMAQLVRTWLEEESD